MTKIFKVDLNELRIIICIVKRIKDIYTNNKNEGFTDVIEVNHTFHCDFCEIVSELLSTEKYNIESFYFVGKYGMLDTTVDKIYLKNVKRFDPLPEEDKVTLNINVNYLDD